MSEVKLGEKNPMYGKHHTLEASDKIRESQIGKNNSFYGKHHTDETKKGMSESSKDNWKDPIYIAKIIASFKNQKFSNTKIELAIQEYLRAKNIKFETQKALPGIPDIYLLEYNIIIFCDGNYFHAFPGKYKSEDIMKFTKSSSKIVQQIWDHDKEVTEYLESQGYVVLRFWEHDINKNFEEVKSRILDTIGCVKVML
jgi:DNA mismatch endonuclease (patch repair protein)